MSSHTQFKNISVEEYTDRSVVVRGDTRPLKEDLKKLGGKYNSRLKGEPGWIFPKSKQNDIVKFIKEGKRFVTEEEAHAGEMRTLEWDSLRNSDKKVYSNSNSNDVLISMIEKLTQKIVLMDKKLSVLMSANNIDTDLKQVSHKKVIKKKVAESDDDSSEEETPKKRLLK